MRCSSAARPSVRIEGSLQASEGSLSVSSAITSISLARTGDQVLRIDF
jgi:hypothetical protein